MKRDNIVPVGLRKTKAEAVLPPQVKKVEKTPSQMNNFEFTEMLQKTGFINQKQVLTFNLDKYYDDILNKKSLV